MVRFVPSPRGVLRHCLAIVVASLCIGNAAYAARTTTATDQSVNLGKLTAFYRATQLQGSIPGAGLEPIPAYLTGSDVDLKYRRNPNLGKEVPFADSINIVRFLGGFRRDWVEKYGPFNAALGEASGDYVVKGANGSLVFRSEIIAQRLKPYLDAGYRLGDITLGIDNVPWALARNGGKEGLFGQVEPPADWGQWQQTVEHFAADLKKLYGPSAAPNFKMGAEYNTRKSFDGDAQDYLQFYSIGYRVLHAAFPNSQIAPGEFSGSGTCEKVEKCVYNVKDFEDRADATGVRPYYLPRSLNSMQLAPNASAPRTIERAVASYEPFGNVIPEIHQFGLLGQPFGDVNHDALKGEGTDQGPRLAAWEFITLMGLHQELHPRRVLHWRSFYSPGGTQVQLLNGSGFADLALDRYLGMDMTRLPVVDRGNGAVASAAIAFQSAGRKAVIIATSDIDAAPAHTALEIDLDKMFTPSQLRTLRAVDYPESNNVFLQIRNDLAAANNLKPEFSGCALCTSEPDRMAVDRQRADQMVESKNGSYVAQLKNSLRFRPATDFRTIRFDGGRIDLAMEGNEMIILELPD